MAKKVVVTGVPAARIEISGNRQRRIEAESIVAALGAEEIQLPCVAALDQIGVAALGTELVRRLRSSGGRPALVDATEICRVPMSTSDLRAIERITDEIAAATGTKPSAGQVISVLIHQYLAAFQANEHSGQTLNQAKTNAGFTPG